MFAIGSGYHVGGKEPRLVAREIMATEQGGQLLAILLHDWEKIATMSGNTFDTQENFALSHKADGLRSVIKFLKDAAPNAGKGPASPDRDEVSAKNSTEITG